MSDDEAIEALARADGLAFANYNMFPMHLKIDETERDVVVDFAAMASLAEPTKSITVLKSTKMFELNDAARTFFQLKVSLFMARPPADEP